MGVHRDGAESVRSTVAGCGGEPAVGEWGKVKESFSEEVAGDSGDSEIL